MTRRFSTEIEAISSRTAFDLPRRSAYAPAGHSNRYRSSILCPTPLIS
jgi:hypothetical protein